MPGATLYCSALCQRTFSELENMESTHGMIKFLQAWTSLKDCKLHAGGWQTSYQRTMFMFPGPVVHGVPDASAMPPTVISLAAGFDAETTGCPLLSTG